MKKLREKGEMKRGQRLCKDPNRSGSEGVRVAPALKTKERWKGERVNGREDEWSD